MTPKEKAASLIKGMALAGAKRYDEAVACALIAVNELIQELTGSGIVGSSAYWKEVKQEIETYGEWY